MTERKETISYYAYNVSHYNVYSNDEIKTFSRNFCIDFCANIEYNQSKRRNVR